MDKMRSRRDPLRGARSASLRLLALPNSCKVQYQNYYRMPTFEQLQSLYRISYQLTYTMIQPIHLICLDDRTKNLYILAGYDEEIEFQIKLNGEVI